MGENIFPITFALHVADLFFQCLYRLCQVPVVDSNLLGVIV